LRVRVESERSGEAAIRPGASLGRINTRTLVTVRLEGREANNRAREGGKNVSETVCRTFSRIK
jgi:hypothetical protein